MIRLAPIALLATACQSQDTVISSVNFAPDAVEADCAIDAVNSVDGLSLAERRGIGTSGRLRATFDAAGEEELLLNIRRPRRGGSDIYVSITPSKPGEPLRRRAARLAVIAADEAIYVNCTDDGRTYGGPTVILKSQQE